MGGLMIDDRLNVLKYGGNYNKIVQKIARITELNEEGIL